MSKKPGVIGSMVGLKVRAGQVTEQLGITYFVRGKITRSDLGRGHCVPAKVRTKGTVAVTDVVVWPQLVEQSLPRGTIIFDGRLQGTLACFGISQAAAFGVSCAHCLCGVDGNPATPTAIQVFEDPPRQFVQGGQSVYLAYSPGTGLPHSFGYLDCGIFDLRNSALTARAESSKALPIVSDIHTLVGRRLIGVSALTAPGSGESSREAVVLGVDAEALGERCDLFLSLQVPGTFKGDSGMLWVTEDGRAAGMHARGEVTDSIQGSLLTTAMSARRVSEALGVELVLG